MQLQKLVRNVYPNLTPYTCQLADLPIEDLKKVLNKDKVYKLSFNESPLGPSSKVIEAMQKSLLELNLYPDSTGEELKEEISRMEGIDKSQLLLSNGADDLIVLLAQTFLELEDEVIIPQITFVQYLASTHLMGAKPVFAPMKPDLSIDLKAILERITEKTKLIFLCNPNNPTGTIIPDSEIEAFLQEVPSNVLVIIDEAYHEYADSEEYSSSVKYVDKGFPVFVVRTFSKIYSLAAVRIGYGIGDARVVDAIHHVRPPFNVNAVAQAGALAALRDQEHVEQAIALNQKGKTQLYELFTEVGWKYINTNGNFIFVDMGRDSQEIFDSLAERGIIVRTLTGYGLEHSLRVSIGDEEGIHAFIQAIKEII
ncbi:histidinol-phosphate transaminase [Ammoniphilus resinae]|uniref:Histidinol-phosphate aminotransferase n=1 Tax=Ammoniphilus resinae TaxID=861532 RepID=A0ABS4GLR0_9BACL|nr:histidinol-phosphate transaminase [Ammoniphilus resinae]MBP1931203.1 histidinol-phosphate aminotransferase [Ammoniphilus resinae]